MHADHDGAFQGIGRDKYGNTRASKLTLLDYPGKVACMVFTAGCNFRCPFCHNASLVIDTYKNEEISLEEVYSHLKKRQGILDGVCVQGESR